MIITSPYVPDPEGYEGGRAFGLTIRGRRMGAGLTLRRCAEDMGISMSDLSAIERGLIAMTTEQRERFEGALRAQRPILADTEPRRLTDNELGGRAALEAAGLEPVDGWDGERGEA